MCRIDESGALVHVGVELRKGLYADRLDDGSVALCQHPTGDLRVAAWEVTLTKAELAMPCFWRSLPVTETAPDSVPIIVPDFIVAAPQAEAPKRKHVRTRPAALPKKSASKKKGSRK